MTRKLLSPLGVDERLMGKFFLALLVISIAALIALSAWIIFDDLTCVGLFITPQSPMTAATGTVRSILRQLNGQVGRGTLRLGVNLYSRLRVRWLQGSATRASSTGYRGIVKMNLVFLRRGGHVDPLPGALGDLRCDVKPKSQSLPAARTSPRKNGSNSCSIDDGGMGSPALATQSLIFGLRWSLDTTGLSAAPCVNALPIRFESSWPMRMRSQLTGR